MLSKNQIIELEITGITSEGNGVGKYEGMAVFVPFTARGDILKVQIVKVLSSYAYGIINEIITSSEDRTEPDCPVFKKCGGCSFRHISYKSELEIKSGFVKDSFERIGKFTGIQFEDICGCDETDFYRNKAQYPVAMLDGKAVSGFYSKRSHRIVPYTECRLQPEIFAQITSLITEFMNEKHIPAYDEKTGKGLIRHIYLRKGYHSDEIMICLVSTHKKAVSFAVDLYKNTDLLRRFNNIKSIVVNVNPDNTNVILGEKNYQVLGKECISDIMCGNKISLSPHSFYQVNTYQAEKLYGIAADFADLKGDEELLDLYCGAGTIGLSMSDKVKHLTGVEVVKQAVENAVINAQVNEIENADFVCGDAGYIAEGMVREGRRPDVIVVDPPRKGCDELTIDSIVKMAPEKVVMISCNPATAARDCRMLCDRGYELKKVRAVDLFARTVHVECVVLLSKVK